VLPEIRVSLARADDEHERKAIEDIRRSGVHILHVFDNEGLSPEFSYTVGLWHTHGHPEILISGLKESLRHRILNNLEYGIRHGREYKDGQSYTDVIDHYRCYFQQIPKGHYRDYLGWDLWFYDDDEFDAVQMLWPSVDHVYSWEGRASDSLKNAQEILTKVPLLLS
jgi:hypothetical protein